MPCHMRSMAREVPMNLPQSHDDLPLNVHLAAVGHDHRRGKLATHLLRSKTLLLILPPPRWALPGKIGEIGTCDL